MLQKHLEDLDSGSYVTPTSIGASCSLALISKFQFTHLFKKFTVKKEKASLREEED